MNSPESTSEPITRLVYIEFFRLVAACAVVITHVNMWAFLFNKPVPAWSLAICAATKFSVPTFMVVAAFLHAKSYERYKDQPSMGSVLLKKWPAVFVPYFVWNLIYLSTSGQVFHVPELNANNIWSFITGYNHLYFISILFQFYILYHWLSGDVKNHRLILISCAMMTLTFYAISEALLWTKGPDNNFFEWYIGNAIFGWALFFAWGVALWKKPFWRQQIAKNTLWLGILSAISYVGYFIEINFELDRTGELARLFFLISGLFYQFLAGNFILSICMRLAHKYVNNSMAIKVGRLGKYTFGIYLSHNFFIPIFLGWVKNLGLNNPGLILFSVTLLTIISSIVLEISLRRRWPILAGLLFGRRSAGDLRLSPMKPA